MSTKRRSPTVVYIAGSPRSGSTLLARLLGSVEDSTTVGEMRLIWDRSFGENWACSCGKPFSDCPFWTSVVASWEGAVDVNVAEGLRVRNTLRTRAMGRLVRSTRRHAPAELGAYAATMDALYSAVAAQAGVGTIVDSSKAPADALTLARLSALDFRVIHLVRDPRAIVQSWTRKLQDPSLPGGTTMRLGLVRPVAMWIHWNMAIRRFGRRMGDPILVRYEDLCRDPDGEVGRILRLLGRDIDGPATNRTEEVEPHTMAGNPMRFEPITAIKEDDEWRRSLPPSKAFIVHLVTWPLLRRLGYD